MNQMMNSSKPKSYFLRSTTAVSLHERFSQVLVDQQTQPRTVTLDPIVLQGGGDALQMVLLMKRQQQKPLQLQTRVSTLRMKQCVRKRRSVWTRLGWRCATRRFLATRLGGFWGFRNKYKRKTRLTSTCRSKGDLRHRLERSRFMIKKGIQKPTAGQTQLAAHLQQGRAPTLRRRYWNRGGVAPTKRQLDAELDQYMSQSRRRLDQQLDEYMSKSKSRLDAQLDEYMSMAGQRDLTWDRGDGDADLAWY